MGLGQEQLEHGVLGFELTQALGFRDLHSAKFGAPLEKVASLKPPLQHSSLSGMLASVFLTKPMICSLVNLLFFMSVSALVVDGLH